VNQNCNASCLVDAYGRYCSGVGMCGLDGLCVCNLGYSGASCEIEELRRLWPPEVLPNGYGGPNGVSCQTCVNGTFCCGGRCNDFENNLGLFGCDCNSDPFWQYEGVACEMICPATVNGVCNGWGTCDRMAECDCDIKTRGHDCGIVCPYNANGVCDGNGICNEQGICECDEGFRGRNCELVCPRPATLPFAANDIYNPLVIANDVCSANGICDELAQCVCDYSYRGTACEMRCRGPWDEEDYVEDPRQPGFTCYGQGTCLEDATCLCGRGYMGADCNMACERCAGSGKLCCHGSCLYTGECMCLNATRQGYDRPAYTGTTCEVPIEIHRPLQNDTTMAMTNKFIAIDGTGMERGICSNKLRLNGPYTDQLGYAWYDQPQNVLQGFVTKFQYQITDRSLTCRDVYLEPSYQYVDQINRTEISRRKRMHGVYFYGKCIERGADGFAFVIRGTDTEQHGVGGGGLGYDGINNSIAVEFDTWHNKQNEPTMGGAAHVSVNTRGRANNSAVHASASVASIPVVELRESAVRTVVIKYKPGNFSLESVNEDVIDNERVGLRKHSPGHLYSTPHSWQFLSSPSVGLLEVFVDDLEVPLISTPIDLGKAMDLDDGLAFVGFTASTAQFFEVHDILQWFFCEGSDCDDEEWMQDGSANVDSSCEGWACPRGYPWDYYPQRTRTTEIGSTT